MILGTRMPLGKGYRREVMLIFTRIEAQSGYGCD